MQLDDLSVRIFNTPNAEPSYDLNLDRRTATVVYDGDIADLLRLGVAIGRQLGHRRPIPIKTITLPE